MKQLLSLPVLILSITLRAQSIPEKADALLTAYTTQNKFSGNVLIAVRDQIVFNKAYGYADRETNRQNTVQTEFRAGSLTKMFTSALILQLAQRHELSLEDKVIKYIPALKWASDITIKHLLSHTSGIRGSTPVNVSNLNEMVLQFKAAIPAFAPGEQFEYNNFNYMLLSHIAQQITHTPYDILLKKFILNKSNMFHSGIDSLHRKTVNSARGYVTNPATGDWVITGNDGEVATASGAGALYTTTEDLYRWSQTTMHQLAKNTGASKDAFTVVKGNYGLGWIINRNDPHYSIGHTGAIPGYLSYFMMFPKDSITIIYLSNYQDLDAKGLEKALTALVYNEPYGIPKQKKAMILSTDQLRQYTGTYSAGEHIEIKVKLEGNKLLAVAPGGDIIELTAEAPDQFFLKGPETEVKFIREGSAVKKIFIDMAGGQTFSRLE